MFCRVAPRDLRLVLNPREGPSRGGQAERANSQNNDVVDLFLTEAGSPSVANRGVSGPLKTGTDRQSKFHQPTGAFIKWPGLMTPFPQMCEGAPDVRIKTFESRDRLWKLLNHARAPFFSMRFQTQFRREHVAIRKSIRANRNCSYLLRQITDLRDERHIVTEVTDKQFPTF